MIEKLEPRHFGPDSGYGGATFSDVIDKVNEIIDAMNGEHDPADIYSEDGRLIAKYNESEDERMIRMIESFLSAYGADYFINNEWREIEVWLEKQKEQKPNIEICPHSIKSKSYSETGYPIEDCDYGLEIALDILEKTIGKVYGFQTDDGIREHQTAIKAVKDAMKEQKPAECIEDSVKFEEGFKAGRESGLLDGQKYVLNNLDSYGLCKPAWSEEDEKMIERLITRLNWITFNTRTDGTSPNITFFDEIDWLKSRRLQPREEIYQSAKHDLAIKFMNYLDENRPEGKMSLSNGECKDIDKAFKENDWAKIMRYVEKYRPSWKPSEEQMKALYEAAQDAAIDREGGNALYELYEHLKRL